MKEFFRSVKIWGRVFYLALIIVHLNMAWSDAPWIKKHVAKRYIKSWTQELF